MKPPIVFIHGWGFNSQLWQPVRERLEGRKTGTIDLGFIKGGETSWHDYETPAIYVGHSLGVLWLLHECQQGKVKPALKALISIAGFSNFMAFTRPETLAQMEEGLIKNPSGQLNHFWRAAGAKGWLDQPEANIDRLKEGLAWLESWDMSAVSKTIDAPIYSIAAKEDRIVPAEATRNEWQSSPRHFPVIWHETAPHTLPLSHPDWLAKQLKIIIASIK